MKQYNIDVCIIPETCYQRVFEIPILLKSLGVRTVGIPNIEIVRRDELEKHHNFDALLCNNLLCMDLLSQHGLQDKVRWLGYPALPESAVYENKKPDCKNELRFLGIGGLNAVNRKQLHLVCAAFKMAYAQIPQLRLTVTVQFGTVPQLIKEISGHPGIKLIQQHLVCNFALPC